METEKDRPQDSLPKKEETPSPNYQDFLEITRTEKPSLGAYIKALCREMQIFDGIDPYVKNPLNVITDKADAFLRRHAGISYEDFLMQAKPETFTENDFGDLPDKKKLRRRLFEHRARLYLSALEDVEKEGHNIDELLRDIEEATIPYIKRERYEPTFQEILRVLRKKS